MYAARLPCFLDFGYVRGVNPLLVSDLDPDPIEQFRQWFDDALKLDLPDANAMALATVGEDGKPSARMVLLKGFDDAGFVFYSNYLSRKGEELAENPRVALILYWAQLHRQIRIEGRAEKLPPDRSDAYFASRARGSQIAAAASPQSRVLRSRAELDNRVSALEIEFEDRDVPRPAHWGGYLVVPRVIEFWQGRPNRLHDRLRYRRIDGGSWTIERLAP